MLRFLLCAVPSGSAALHPGGYLSQANESMTASMRLPALISVCRPLRSLSIPLVLGVSQSTMLIWPMWQERSAAALPPLLAARVGRQCDLNGPSKSHPLESITQRVLRCWYLILTQCIG